MNRLNLDEAKEICRKVIDGIVNVYVGEEPLLKKLLAAGLSNGHVLFEDYPGLGKTLLAKVFTRVIGCDCGRIQFTPDLLPADIIGGKVWRPQDTSFELVKGPIFTNILLADEINRTPPKTQAALLEAMEERRVTIDGEDHILDRPFFVLATQNPIEQEGTYPLPEAQLDRFMVKLSMGYPQSVEMEGTILQRRIAWRKDDPSIDVKPVIDKATFLALQDLTEDAIYVDPCIIDYISRIVRATREHPKVIVGASPRGGLALLKLSRATAIISGRDFVTPDDVKTFASDVLVHRIILRVEDTIEGTKEQEIVREVVDGIAPPMEFSPKGRDNA
jgi:MoxR-like ATPase